MRLISSTTSMERKKIEAAHRLGLQINPTSMLHLQTNTGIITISL